MLNKIQHIKRNFHVTSNTLSNPYSQAYHSLEHFMMIKLGKREDKERSNTRNSPGTNNESGHRCIKLFKDQFGFVELGIHLLEGNMLVISLVIQSLWSELSLRTFFSVSADIKDKAKCLNCLNTAQGKLCIGYLT